MYCNSYSCVSFLYSLWIWTLSKCLTFGAQYLQTITLVLARGFSPNISQLISVFMSWPHIFWCVADKKEGFVLGLTPKRVYSIHLNRCGIAVCQLQGRVHCAAAHTCCEVKSIGYITVRLVHWFAHMKRCSTCVCDKCNFTSLVSVKKWF